MARQTVNGTWFDDEAKGVERWAGRNDERQDLLRTARARTWVLKSWSDGPATTPRFEAIPPDEAAAWLITNEHELPAALEEAIAGLGAHRGRRASAPDGVVRTPAVVRLSPAERLTVQSEAARAGRGWSDHVRYRLLEAVDAVDILRTRLRTCRDRSGAADVLKTTRDVETMLGVSLYDRVIEGAREGGSSP